MFFEGARGENLLDLGEREINLLIRVVEMRREADAGLGAIVHQDLAGDQLAHHLRRVGAINGDGAGAFGGVHGCVDAPAAGLRAGNNARRLAHGLFADGPDADLIENFQAGLASVERRDVRGAIEIAEGIIAAINRTGFEIERALMREPPGERGLAFGAQVGADVKIADARSAAEPLENSADSEVTAERAHVNRDGAGGLKEIEDDVGADAVGAFDDGAGVDDSGAAEEHQGNGDEESVLVNRGENFFERDADAVLTGNGFDAGAETRLFVVEILDGGKFEVHQDDFVARAAEIKTGTDNGLDNGDVLMERNLAAPRSDQRADAVAGAHGHVPPALFPGAHAAETPGAGVAFHALVNAARHGTEGIADHVGGALKDGELRAPLEKRVHSIPLPPRAAGRSRRRSRA